MTVYAYSAFQIGPGQWQIVDTAGGGPTLKGYNSEAEARAAANKLNAGLSGTEKQYASSETAGDAAGPNTDPATQNTGTDSTDRSEPVTQEEQKNQDDNNDSGNDTTTPALTPKTVVESKSDVSQTPPATQVAGPKSKDTASSDNPLDAYPSYTYGLSLHVLTREDYNNMVKNPYDFTPTKTLISSASRYQNIRDPEFDVDFYFDSFKLETIIGLNANNRGTNGISFKFSIIEPYGMTLLDRLMHVNNAGLNGKNYLDMPYLLELNFFGADDTGKLGIISDQTKWFPIRIIGFKIKAGIKGAEYDVEAVPFNHSANLETVQAIKTRFEVTAGTVAEYFSSTSDTATQNAVAAAMNEDSVRKEKIKNAAADTAARQEAANKKAEEGDQSGASEADSIVNGNPGVRTPETVTPTDPGVPDTPISLKTKSFTAAYNAWNQYELKNNNVRFADRIQFNFLDPEIANSSIVEDKKNPSRKVAETDATTNSKADPNSSTPATTADFQQTVHSLEAGTAVNDVINLVLTNSQYFQKQVIDPTTQNKTVDSGTKDTANAAEEDKPVKMWKIVPSIELGDFDASRNKWGKTITFHINSYDVYQKRDSRLPRSQPPAPVKRYDWLYTGHNKSIINFDIDFNALYFTAFNADRGNGSAATGAAQTTDEGKNKDKTDNERQQGIDQNTNEPNSGTMQTTAGGSIQRSDAQNAASAVQSQYTSAGGDMVQLKLQILGDPEFIKQDDLFLNPRLVDSSSKYAGKTGSLNMDSGEIYCWVTFKTPSDFSDTTGLYDLKSTNKYAVSEFSGYYRVIRVESEFKGGKFMQTLELIRQPKQEAVNKPATVTTADGGRAGQEGSTDAEMTDKSNNPAVSGSDVARTDAPETPTQTVTKTEDADVVNVGSATGSDLDAAYAGDVPNTQEDQQLAAVADSPAPAQTVQEATSGDGSTVAVQATPAAAVVSDKVVRKQIAVDRAQAGLNSRLAIIAKKRAAGTLPADFDETAFLADSQAQLANAQSDLAAAQAG